MVILLLIFALSYAESESFTYSVLPNSRICFEELIAEQTSYIFEVEYTLDIIEIDILKPDMTSVFESANMLTLAQNPDRNSTIARYPSTSFESGVY